MTIAEVDHSVTTSAAPDLAFALFTGRMGDWWPRGRTLGPRPHADIVIEPWPGGRWFERDDEGHEIPWGHVRLWEPPHRLVLIWQLDASFRFDAAVETEVELTFTPEGKGTRVRLVHRNLERLGARADDGTRRIAQGWESRLADFKAWAARSHGDHA
ncbi:MAG: SRPBCC family protein [Paracoccaceae bacterium]|nr:SRPBCC family protein [Paracoccaceae bacterium]